MAITTAAVEATPARLTTSSPSTTSSSSPNTSAVSSSSAVSNPTTKDRRLEGSVAPAASTKATISNRVVD